MQYASENRELRRGALHFNSSSVRESEGCRELVVGQGEDSDLYWVPITEAALRIGVHRRTIMRWCSSGKLGGNAMRTPGWYWYVRDSWIRGFGRFVGGAANEASA